MASNFVLSGHKSVCAVRQNVNEAPRGRQLGAVCDSSAEPEPLSTSRLSRPSGAAGPAADGECPKSPCRAGRLGGSTRADRRHRPPCTAGPREAGPLGLSTATLCPGEAAAGCGRASLRGAVRRAAGYPPRRPVAFRGPLQQSQPFSAQSGQPSSEAAPQ